MIATPELAIVFGCAWFALMALSSLLVLWLPSDKWRSQSIRIRLPHILILALLLRLVPALLLGHGALYDIESYRLVGRAILSGHSPYDTSLAVYRYPYLPGELSISAFALYLNEHFGLPFAVLVKLPSVFADALIAPLLAAGLLRAGAARPVALQRGVLYACNPVTVLVCAYHGQFDALALLGIVAGWYLTTKAVPEDNRWQRLWGMASAVGLAILMKPWPVLVLPAFMKISRRWLQALLIAAIALGVPSLLTLLYAVLAGVPVGSIAHAVFGYRAQAGQWGLGVPLSHLRSRGWLSASQVQFLSNASEVLVVLGVAIYVLRERRRSVALVATSSVLIFYALSARFGVQYLAWVMPMALASLSTRAWLPTTFAVVAGGAMLLVYFFEGIMYLPARVSPASFLGELPLGVAYLAAVFWLLNYQLRRRPDLPLAKNGEERAFSTD